MPVIQAVFVVDVGIGTKPGEDDAVADATIGAVRLSAIKILNHLSTTVNNKGTVLPGETNNNMVLWGFKFFNTVGVLNFSDRSDFKEYNRTNYEQFEGKLESRFETERVKRNGSLTSGESEDMSQKMQDALQQITYEFQWQTPYLMSPVKRRIGSKLNKKKGVQKKKFVFFFSKCPHTLKETKEFVNCGDSCCDQSEITESILPDKVLHHFQSSGNISIYLIDLNRHGQRTGN